MSTKSYCDFCGKETFHMDLGRTKCGKDICPQCMKIRCVDMARVIMNVDMEHMRSEDVQYLHTALSDIVERLGLRRELKKAEDKHEDETGM